MISGDHQTRGVAPSTGFESWSEEARAPLWRLYQSYRQRQVSALLSLLPDGAVRPLYRMARSWAVQRGLHEKKDPLATLVRFCETLLPLPPFPVWLEDFREHRGAHLKELDAVPAGAGEGVPVTLDVRSLEEDGRRWYAALCVFRKDDVWRGYLTFRAEDSGAAVRTTDIFRSQEPSEIRERFQEFDVETLRAFLRSTLP